MGRGERGREVGGKRRGGREMGRRRGGWEGWWEVEWEGEEGRGVEGARGVGRRSEWHY